MLIFICLRKIPRKEKGHPEIIQSRSEIFCEICELHRASFIFIPDTLKTVPKFTLARAMRSAFFPFHFNLAAQWQWLRWLRNSTIMCRWIDFSLVLQHSIPFMVKLNYNFGSQSKLLLVLRSKAKKIHIRTEKHLILRWMACFA